MNLSQAAQELDSTRTVANGGDSEATTKARNLLFVANLHRGVSPREASKLAGFGDDPKGRMIRLAGLRRRYSEHNSGKVATNSQPLTSFSQAVLEAPPAFQVTAMKDKTWV